MNKLTLILILVGYPICYSMGQEIGELFQRNWKIIETDRNIKTEYIDRIEAQKDEILDILWFQEESIGKCVVSFNSKEFNKKLNLGLQVNDTISTPFKINFRWFLGVTPEDESSFEKNYFISDSLADTELDLHTLTINNIIPIGFQIFFENDYFSSRMYLNSEDETEIYLYPINQNLKQEIVKNRVKGILNAEYKFTEKDAWQKREFHELGDTFKVQIEYQFHFKSE